MMCRMKENPGLSENCYERVLQALHVTLADIIRGVQEVQYDNMSHLVEKPTMWFLNRSDTNRPVQSQKRARSLKFWS